MKFEAYGPNGVQGRSSRSFRLACFGPIGMAAEGAPWPLTPGNGHAWIAYARLGRSQERPK